MILDILVLSKEFKVNGLPLIQKPIMLMVLLDIKAVAISQHRPLSLNMFAQTLG